ncbi:hypothetical protein CHISP_3585 [Chitinispirillum alkaliphilum]|nr:hypothetical protein CHISP_3585 [Chitinispirillum alkaliphilum]
MKLLLLTLICIVTIQVFAGGRSGDTPKGCENGEVIIEKNIPKLSTLINRVIPNLSQASFITVREGWTHDYGLRPGTGMLNTFEYIHSLVSYETLINSLVCIPVYRSGPHSTSGLHLTNKESFGHYNPLFLSAAHLALQSFLSSPGFIEATKDDMLKFGILEKIERLKYISNHISNNEQEFQYYVENFQTMLSSGTVKRTYYPNSFRGPRYWYWADTVYNFWIRREVDGTRHIWIEIIEELANAYSIQGGLIGDYY